MRIKKSQLRRIIQEQVRAGVDMLNWNQLEVGDLVDVDSDYNFYSRMRITQKLEDVSRESGLEPGPGFVGSDENGEEIVFAVQDVVPTSYEKYAMVEYRRLRRIIREAVLREGNSTNPRGLKALLASLGVKGQEFKAVAGVLSTTYHDFEGGPEDMKDEVEIHSGGLPMSVPADTPHADVWIDWPIETYQEIWNLYKKAEQSYKTPTPRGPRF